MDHSMALRCILQRCPPASETSDSCIADSASTSSQKFALIPNSVTVASLLRFVLRQLGIKYPASTCTAKVVLPGWKTLSLNEICTDTENTTVFSLLGNVSNIAVLLIQLPITAPPQPLSPGAIRRLLRSLLPKHTDEPAVQVDWLRQSGCPMGEPDLLSYLAAPDEFAFSEPTRVDFAAWRRRLRQLAAQSLSKSATWPPATAAGADDVKLEETGEGECLPGDGERGGDEGSIEDDAGNNEEEGESGFGDEPEADDAGGYCDENSRSTQAALERLSQLSRVPRLPAAAAAAAAAGAASGKENSVQRCHGNKSSDSPAAWQFSPPRTLTQTPQPRHRLFIDPHSEIPQLERHFAVNAHPSSDDCRRIAEELNSLPFRRCERRQMQAKNVRLWFKNKRARTRKADMTPSPVPTPPAVQSAPTAPPLLLPMPPHLAKPLQLQMRLPIVSSISSSIAGQLQLQG